MVSIQGIFDGKTILPLETVPTGKSYKLIITFVEEMPEDDNLHHFTAQSDAFLFWENEEEDIYQDYLPQI